MSSDIESEQSNSCHNRELIDQFNRNKTLTQQEWITLLDTFTDEDRAYAASIAKDLAVAHFGHDIFFRGIVEFTNICKNDCIYCGIRRSNECVNRYRLNKEEILQCCEEGYHLGYRTFVLQGGEDAWFTDDRLCEIVSAIHARYPECAITLSVGERSRESYQRLFQAGADRYLLRHETANPHHYHKLHPRELSWSHRMQCLNDLKEIGYQTGCGFMVGSPYQTSADIAKDMMYIHDFQPQMIGIGPFIPHKDTPFRDFPAGSPETTLFVLSLCRIMMPQVLLPATTALGTVRGDGRQMGVLAGCNVIMPNLSPMSVRKKYLLYDNKAGIHDSARVGMEKLEKQLSEIGYHLSISRGDFS